LSVVRPEQNVSVSAEVSEYAGLCGQCCFSVGFDLDLVPSCVVRLSFEACHSDKVLDLVFSFHNPDLDYSVEYVL